LIGRENLENSEIENGKIKDGEIKDNNKDIEIADCEKFFHNYIDYCAISLHSANLIVDKIAIEIANTY
jgi:hypothetical protein